MPVSDESLSALAGELGRVLVARGMRVTTAESCTGGLVAASMTSIAGSSNWFDEAFVTYSNEAKSRALGVEGSLIEAHGAVSEPVARAMAEGALARAGADVSVAITGVAGPGGGTVDKPVGTVWIAWAARGVATRATLHRLGGDRDGIRRASVEAALRGLIAIVDARPARGP